MQITIKKAKLDEIETVLSILREAARFLEEKGVPLWKHDELKFELAETDVKNGLFYIARVDGEIAGCVRFQLEDKEYWDDVTHEDSAFIHRLAVRRKFAGKGISKAMLDWAKEEAKIEGKTFLRLDCANREPLRYFYESQGFTFHSEKNSEPHLVIRYEFKLVKGGK